MKHQERTYRRLAYRGQLISFRVTVKETDVLIHATRPLEDITKELILKYRGYIEAYIRQHPGFAKTLRPWPPGGPAPLIVKDMAAAGEKVGVGPMAAVAGAMLKSGILLLLQLKALNQEGRLRKRMLSEQLLSARKRNIAARMAHISVLMRTRLLLLMDSIPKAAVFSGQFPGNYKTRALIRLFHWLRRSYNHENQKGRYSINS